jgi:hypothetical protein
VPSCITRDPIQKEQENASLWSIVGSKKHSFVNISKTNLIVIIIIIIIIIIIMRIVVVSVSALLVIATTASVVDALLAPNRPNCRSGPQTSRSTTITTTTTATQRSAFWRHWIPESDNAQYHQPPQQEQGSSIVGITHPADRLDESSSLSSSSDHGLLQHHHRYHHQPLLPLQAVTAPSSCTPIAIDNDNDATVVEQSARRALVQSLVVTFATVLVATSASTLSFPLPSGAVSGGGLDFAGIDITGQDFSNNINAYKGKDFTQVIAKGTNFRGSNLQGCRFYKAYLVRTEVYAYAYAHILCRQTDIHWMRDVAVVGPSITSHSLSVSPSCILHCTL